MNQKKDRDQAQQDVSTHTVMLRLPYSLYTRLVQQAQNQTLPPAVLARMLVLDGVNRLERREGE